MNSEIFINSDPGIGNVPLGSICIASNEGRFDAQYLSTPLTTFSVGGWDKDPLQALLDFIAPSVSVPRRFTYKTFDIADYFLRDEGDEDVRAIGGDFAKIQNQGKGEVEAKTENKGLAAAIDTDELKGDPTLETRTVDRLTQRLLRNEIRRALALLNAAATSTGKTWGSTADPDRDVADELLTGFTSSGVRATRVLYGSTAWSLRDKAFRAQNTAGSNASAQKTVDQVGQYLAAQAQTMDALYRNNAGSLAVYLAGAVLMYNTASSLSVEDPSNIKRFVSNADGSALKVYRQQVNAKRIEISVEHYSLIKVTSTLGIRKFTVS